MTSTGGAAAAAAPTTTLPNSDTVVRLVLQHIKKIENTLLEKWGPYLEKQVAWLRTSTAYTTMRNVFLSIKAIPLESGTPNKPAIRTAAKIAIDTTLNKDFTASIDKNSHYGKQLMEQHSQLIEKLRGFLNKDDNITNAKLVGWNFTLEGPTRQDDDSNA